MQSEADFKMNLKEEKLQFQLSCEEYIEKEKLYEMFEDMMKELIVHRPKDPVNFLIEKLNKPKSKCSHFHNRCLCPVVRIVMVGPPGSKRKEIALGLSAHFNDQDDQGKEFQCISVGDLITRQIIQKNQQYCEDIETALGTYSYVPDEIVIALVRQQIEQMEKEQKSWIIEGFPRTEAQAIALQKMGIIPDKFIMLTQSEEATYAKLVSNMSSDENKPNMLIVHDEQRRAQLARNALLEYKLNIEGVQKICKGMITTL